MDSDVSEDVICLNDELYEVVGDEKPLCLFGEADCVPVDVEGDEYDVIPDRPPEEWYERYCLRDDFTPECKALQKKAGDFYNAKELVRSDVKVELLQHDSCGNTAQADTAEESGSVVVRKAKWFSMVDVAMDKNAATRRGCSSLGIVLEKRGRGRPPNQGRVSVIPKKCGRGRPAKHSELIGVCEKRGRGRPPKQGGMLTKKSIVSSAPSKRGRGRPAKQNGAAVCTENDMDKQNSKKCSRSGEIVLVEFLASQLCGGCCDNIGKKFAQDVRGKLLRVEFVTGNMDDGNAVVKRPRGRPRKA